MSYYANAWPTYRRLGPLIFIQGLSKKGQNHPSKSSQRCTFYKSLLLRPSVGDWPTVHGACDEPKSITIIIGIRFVIM